LKIRRIKRRIRKSTTRRYRRRRKQAGNVPEIKYLTLQSQNQASRLGVLNVNDDDLYGTQNFISNILENISVGASFVNRVGNKIYVMSINVHFLVYGCPAATTYNVGSFLLRHIWHNQRTAAGVSIPGFFGIASTINFNSFVDRKSVTVHRDKYFPIRGSDYATTQTGSTVNCGAIREIEYSIPVNRYVTFTPTGAVKEDKDVYSFAVLVATPGLDSTNDLRQIACWHAKYRIYFKDA